MGWVGSIPRVEQIMNWMLLSGGASVVFGEQIQFLNCTRESLILDFANSLANQVRAAGRFGSWTTAHHMLLVEHMMRGPRGVGLLHDAHEAITSDIPTPWAKSLGPDIQEAMSLSKQRVQDAFEKFIGFKAPRYRASALHQADYDAFLIEASILVSASNSKSHLKIASPPSDMDYPGVYAMFDQLSNESNIAQVWAEAVAALPVTP